MKTHYYSVESSLHHKSPTYFAVGCAFVATAVGAWLSVHHNLWWVAWAPAPSALLLHWLSYSFLWSCYLWRWNIFQKLHKVPVFDREYRALSVSGHDDTMPPRDCEITIRQTWTDILISYKTSLMKGDSIAAMASPDLGRVIAIFKAEPRKVFDQEWLKKNSVTIREAQDFAKAQELVVEFQFKDGVLQEAEWYTDLQENHRGVFSGFAKNADPGAAPDSSTAAVSQGS
jgi:hypothetical protein